MLISEFRYSKQLFFRLWNYFRVDINKLYKKKFNNCKFEITSYEIAYYSESEFSMVALVFTVFESFNIKSGLITVPAFAPRFFNQFLPLINASIDLSWKPFFFWGFVSFNSCWLKNLSADALLNGKKEGD